MVDKCIALNAYARARLCFIYVRDTYVRVLSECRFVVVSWYPNSNEEKTRRARTKDRRNIKYNL